MSFNIAGSSTSDLSLSTVKELNTPEKLNRFLKGRLENIDTHINTLTAQEVDGVAFLEITQEYLTKNLEIPLGPAKKILKLINEIKEEYSTAGIGSLISGIAGLKLQDKKIWVRYNYEYVSLPESVLKIMRVSDVNDLKRTIKAQLNISGNVTIHRGSETLEDSKLVTELHNTEDNAYDIIVTENDDESSSSDEKEEDAKQIEPNRIEEAFQVKYQGTTLETFCSRLKLFHDEWYQQIKPYAPYLTIIQSSGSGKTRLVGELRTKGIYILYICKRHESSSGYPASTPYVQKILETIRDYKFGALLSIAIKEIKNKNWSAEEFWNIQIKDDHKAECNDFWRSVFKSLLQQKKPSSDSRDENFVKKLVHKASIVCCIDEAHELFAKATKAKDDETYFVKWRRQIRDISWVGFFNILLSTSGKIGNFLPPVTQDTRSARSHDFVIFPAYLDVNTMDVLAPLAENVGKEYDYTRVVYLGIPLWGSLAQAGVSLINLVHLASQKIRNFSKKNNDYLANLACMACSLSLEVSPRIAEVDSLIASHMATALGVSLDRTSILCTYPSDPILASGALKGIIDVGWENCLDTLLELFSRGVVEEGERGELVNRILFSKAYADAVRECFPDSPVTYLQKVPLKLFLKSLLREEIDGLDELLNRMGIDEAEIGFNHWTSLLATNQKYVESGGMKFLTENLVIEAYHRHTAFKMPLGFPVIDHIIPFKYNAGYGIISIQNKNSKKTTFGAKDISSLIHPSYSFGKWKKGYKILGIYIDLGLDREKAVESKAELKSRNVPQTRSKNKNNEDKEDVKNDYDQIIYIQGVGSFKCCSKEISERLSKILFTRPWPLDTQWSEFDEKTDLKREDVIKTFLPLVFEQKQSLVDKWQLI
ncbi:unnamed protein product [Rhizophagus irregularis]|uniref:SAM domain-containing protein n=1 Tax=Rhizophagus irregularis TaxID=588596 RepID=A0A915ZTM6_9GLOM|nr:unnamed protein product [Rhizophagus irregularis]CAB5386673.1 unnamed protein product [Rhizophagus irregularis]